MNNRMVIFGLMLLMVTAVFSQGKLNPYKYVIVPRQFDFQKSQDAHQINSLTKFLFEKNGFIVFYHDDVYPKELQENMCLALNVKLIDKSNMLKTRMLLELKNCNNQMVLQSPEVDTKEKDLKKGYQEAIRKAFVSVEKEGYTFSNHVTINDNQQSNKTVVVKENQPAIKKEIGITQEIIIEKPVMTEPKYQEKVPIIAAIPKIKNNLTVEGDFSSNKQTLKIQKQGNQFVVSDAKNNVIGILYATSQANYFIIKWLQSDDNLPKLAFLNQDGDLVIDDKETVVVYKSFKQ